MFPQYMFEFPNMNTLFPFYIKDKQYISVPHHRHDFIEFSMVVEGSGTEWINGVPHPMRRGTVVLLLPFQIHRIEADTGTTLRMIVCNFDMELILSKHEAELGLSSLVLGNEHHEPYILAEEKAFRHILTIGESMLGEYREERLWKHLILKSKLVEALSLFDRLRQNKNFVSEIGKRRKELTWGLLHYIYQHYREPLSLTELGVVFALHPVQISELIKEQLGIGFASFVQQLRIRHACSLLLSSDMSIIDIAMDSGFGSFQTFFRTFKRLKGTTPLAYRNTVLSH